MSNLLNRAKTSSEAAEQNSKLKEAYVLSTSDTDDTLSEHSVKLKTASSDQEEAEVLRDTAGDIYLPPPGSTVTIGYFGDNTPIVLGGHDINTTVEELESGERRIGHGISLSHILFNSDGSITIENDGGTTVTIEEDVVKINDGTDPVVTDISTSTDSDGHVTSVSAITNDNILL